MSQSRAKRIRRLLKQALTTEENNDIVENLYLHSLHKHEQENRNEERQHRVINPVRQAKNHMTEMVRAFGLRTIEAKMKVHKPAGATEA